MRAHPTIPMHGVAIDSGSGLEAAIKKARGAGVRPDDFMTFKRAVVSILGRDATAVLVDATHGPALLNAFPKSCSPVMAFEADVYHISAADRITVLPQNLTIADYERLGVGQLKFFMYYAPNDDVALNERKHRVVESIGAECKERGLSFLMEPLVYDRALVPGTPEFAGAKPELVRRATEVFARERFQVSVLKVEVPVDLAFVEGFGSAKQSLAEAKQAMRAACDAAGEVPIVYLSAGVPFEHFEASLKLARDAGVKLAGFMCGRALWSEAIDVFGGKGEAALADWLADTGIKRFNSLKGALA